MPTTVTGVLYSLQSGGTSLPWAGATLYLDPSITTLRVQYGGSGAFVPLAQNIALPAGHQYGASVTTDAGGTYSFKIPLLAETRPSDALTQANLRWMISRPDGIVYSGPALSAAGPFSIDELLQSYGWVVSSGMVAYAPLQGTVARGTIPVTGTDSVAVLFQGGTMPSSSYQVLLTPSKDSNTGVVPVTNATSKATTGFTLELSSSFTGTVDYLAIGG